MRGEGHPVHLYRPPLGPVNTNHSNKVKVRHGDVTEFVGGKRKEGRKERKQLDKWTMKRSRVGVNGKTLLFSNIRQSSVILKCY